MKFSMKTYEIDDERQHGRTIDLTFKGELREEQKTAMNEILQFDNGILHAATAFGKTVVCSAIIAEKKVNTLIILESSALMEQWKESLEKYSLEKRIIAKINTFLDDEKVFRVDKFTRNSIGLFETNIYNLDRSVPENVIINKMDEALDDFVEYIRW